MMIKNIVFDIGGVLVDWNPRYLFAEIFDTPEEMEYFLSTVCTTEWNHTLDLGRSWEDAALELVTNHPEYKKYIYMYWDRWMEMFKGPIHETVDILMELKRMKMPVYALSNWNDEKLGVAIKEFPFLRLFDGKIISGEVKLAKPDPSIYTLLLKTYSLNPRETLFIDDRSENVQAAQNLGIEAVHFTTPYDLEQKLIAYQIFPDNADNHQEEPPKGCGGGCSCHAP